MSNFYEKLCQSFIKPSRQLYNRHDLGNPLCETGKRIDFEIINSSSLKLKCSYYANFVSPEAPCIVYLHGLNGSRLQALPYIKSILSSNLNFCAFDFAGTGQSDGQYVSLGANEHLDILQILQYINNKYKIKKFILWGRSMGAAAAIKFCSLFYSKRPSQDVRSAINFSIVSIILDSPFCSLKDLALQIGKQKINIPQILIKALLIACKSSIQTKANFKMQQLELLSDAATIRCPVLIISSTEDKLINSAHSDKIYKAILHNEKDLLHIKGEHYDLRDERTIKYINQFILKTIHDLSKSKKSRGINTIRNSAKTFHFGNSSLQFVADQLSQKFLRDRRNVNSNFESNKAIFETDTIIQIGGKSKNQVQSQSLKNSPMFFKQNSSSHKQTPHQFQQKCSHHKQKIRKPVFFTQTSAQKCSEQYERFKNQKQKTIKYIQTQVNLNSLHLLSDKKNLHLQKRSKQKSRNIYPIVDIKRSKQVALEVLTKNNINLPPKLNQDLNKTSVNIYMKSFRQEKLQTPVTTVRENYDNSKSNSSHLNVITQKLRKNKEKKENIKMMQSNHFEGKWSHNKKLPPHSINNDRKQNSYSWNFE